MKSLSIKQIAILVITLTVVAVGVVFVVNNQKPEVVDDTPVETEQVEETDPRHQIIGQSVEGRDIESFTYGQGDTHLLFIGGVHGGYEWNSVLLAYRFLDYFNENPEAIPDNLTVTIIPSANPDGVYEVIGKEGRFSLLDTAGVDSSGTGRFNANNVDLNRNFDCKWQPESSWRGNTVSAGTKPFSEPESQAIRDFVLDYNPQAVVFWHSQANNVYASECENGVIPETVDIMNTYANAADYGAVESFNAYPITGDAEGWLASINIPAITVELETHGTVEWDRNLRGVEALFEYYGN